MSAALQGTIVDEGERLKAAELEAATRYHEALEQFNLSEMKVAALAWKRAGDAPGEYLEAL